MDHNYQHPAKAGIVCSITQTILELQNIDTI